MIEIIGQPAPDFTLTDLQGKDVTLQSLLGRPVLLNVFKSTCPWCQTEMPRLGNIYSRLPNLDVNIQGVVVGKDDAAAASRFAQEKELNFPMALDDRRELRDRYPLTRVPTLILITAAGLIGRLYEGSSEQLTGVVEQTLLAAAGGDRMPDYYLVGNG